MKLITEIKSEIKSEQRVILYDPRQDTFIHPYVEQKRAFHNVTSIQNMKLHVDILFNHKDVFCNMVSQDVTWKKKKHHDSFIGNKHYEPWS